MFDIPFTREAFFAGVAILVSFIRYTLYFKALYRREARPHLFTWFSWSLTVGIVAVAQYKLGGGPSVWPLALVSATCLFISILAIFIGEKNITRSDWFALISVLISTVLWQMTDSPSLAITCLVITDVFSYYPTFRKSWNDPWGEPTVSYVWAGSRYFFTLFAVPHPTLSNMAYIFFSMLSDWGLVLFIMWRKKVLGNKKAIQNV